MCSYLDFVSRLFLCLVLTVLPEHEQKLPARINETQACDQHALGEGKSYQCEKLEKDTQPPWHDDNRGGLEEEPEVSEFALSTLSSKAKHRREKKVPASVSSTSAIEGTSVLVDEAPASEEAPPSAEQATGGTSWKWPRYEALNFGATSGVASEPHTAAGEASRTDKPHNIVLGEELTPQDTSPAVPIEDLPGTEPAAPDATTEDSQAELITEDFDNSPKTAEKNTLSQNDDISDKINEPYESTSGPDVAQLHSARARDAEFLKPPPRPALGALRDEIDSHPSPPSAPSSIATTVLEAAAPKAPTRDSHTITLKILNGSKVHRSIVFIRACTRTAILNEARAYCEKCAEDNQSLAILLEKGYDLALMSLNMYGHDMDLSTYKVENLSSLVRSIEKTAIPRFTLRIFEV